MDPRKLIGQDERLVGICAYCGGSPDTRDHVPSRVLLDEPFPANLPVVGACFACNNSFSRDELYVACLIECIIAGTTDPRKIGRDKIARKLDADPSLATTIARCRHEGDPPVWEPDVARVHNVMIKLTQGHAAWELTLPAMGKPSRMSVVPLPCMTDSQRAAFEMPPSADLWPELGSRTFHRVIEGRQEVSWQEVQAGRYRYCVDQAVGLKVRLVLSEYLACMAFWE